MDQLNTFIRQARESGQTDEQIRGSLLAAGWQPGQVNAALMQNPPSSAYNPANTSPQSAYQLPNLQQAGQVNAAQPQLKSAPKFKRPKGLLLIATVLVAVIIIVGIISLLNKKTSFNSAVNQFIAAIQDKDKSKADSLESAAAKAYFLKTTGDSSFYDSCQKAGSFCVNSFSKSSLAKAKVIESNYGSASGVAGRKIVFNEQQESSKSQSCGGGQYVLELDLIPHGHSWQVDNVSLTFNSSGNLCAS